MQNSNSTKTGKNLKNIIKINESQIRTCCCVAYEYSLRIILNVRQKCVSRQL